MFEDIFNRFVLVPNKFSGIIICEFKYIINSVEQQEISYMDTSDSYMNMPRQTFTVNFEIIESVFEFSNNK